MKKLILALLLLASPAYAAERAVLQDGDGNALGTTANPIKATVTGAVGDGTGAGNFTTIDGTDLEILTGDITIGNGTPNTTQNGEDFYVEGTMEVDSTARFDGALTANSTIACANTITSSRTTDIGWSVVATANQACTTTCTSACVFGVNTAATEADIVDCADATADECLCAGAN